MSTAIRFTDVDVSSPPNVGKKYTLVGGELLKDITPYVNQGHAHVCEVADMAAFADRLNCGMTLAQNVLIYGVPKVNVGEGGMPLVTKANKQEGAITRSNDDFVWPEGPGIFAADYDPREGHTALSKNELWSLVSGAVPELLTCDVVWGTSSSSHVHDDAGNDLTGLKGQRLYFGVAHGTDIERAAKVIEARLWLAGHGYIMISKSGAQLVRCTLDTCMYQPSRIDFAAGAICGAGLEQRRPDAHLISEGVPLMDTSTLRLTVVQEATFERLKEQAKADTLPAAQAQRNVHTDARIVVEAETLNCSVVELISAGRREQLLKMHDDERPILDSLHVLHLSDGRSVSVHEVLCHSNDYQGCTARDPLEPDYRGGSITAKIYANERRVVSHAHGIQRTYILGTDEQYRTIFIECWNRLRVRPKRMEGRVERMLEVKL